MTPEKHKEWKRKHDSIVIWCLIKSSCCFIVTVVAITMQGLDILALQWCLEEPLLGFYWPLWTMLGVSSSIAMLGVILSQINRLRGNEFPAYPVALGTPVLVAAAFGDFVKKEFEKIIKRNEEKKDVENENEENGLIGDQRYVFLTWQLPFG